MTVTSNAHRLVTMSKNVLVDEPYEFGEPADRNRELTPEQEAEIVRRLKEYKINPKNLLTQKELDDSLNREFAAGFPT